MTEIEQIQYQIDQLRKEINRNIFYHVITSIGTLVCLSILIAMRFHWL